MPKIYVLLEEIDYEGSTVKAVYAKRNAEVEDCMQGVLSWCIE